MASLPSITRRNALKGLPLAGLAVSAASAPAQAVAARQPAPITEEAAVAAQASLLALLHDLRGGDWVRVDGGDFILLQAIPGTIVGFN